jgi:3-hydroxyisobutyrate dehydrogenase
MSKAQPIAFLGTGLMGQPMALNLLQADLPLIAYNRTREKLIPLETAGAQIAPDAATAINSSTTIILMLTNRSAIESLLFTPETSLAKRCVIQMGTISPQDSLSLQARLEKSGGEYLEAPVLGSIPEAKSGKLLVMVGSTKEQFSQYLELLSYFGEEPMYIEEVGTAAALKLALNQLIASLTTAFGMSLAFLAAQGVDREKFMTILRQSALYAPTFDKKLGRMSDRNYDNPNFPTKHLLKDVDLFLQQAEGINLDTMPLQAVRQILAKTLDLGLGEQDYAALYDALSTH